MGKMLSADSSLLSHHSHSFKVVLHMRKGTSLHPSRMRQSCANHQLSQLTKCIGKLLKLMFPNMNSHKFSAHQANIQNVCLSHAQTCFHSLRRVLASSVTNLSWKSQPSILLEDRSRRSNHTDLSLWTWM